MPQEQKHLGLILKKTQYAEADEIITIFTRDCGKMRVLAKSVKRSTSKLQHALQPLFLLEFATVGRDTLPKIIRAQATEVFHVVSTDSERVHIWFVAAELLQKSLPDDQNNEQLFDLVTNYLRFLNQPDLSPPVLRASLVAFKISLLQHIGLAIHCPSSETHSPKWFSQTQGGFHTGNQLADSQPVGESVWQTFIGLRDWNYAEPMPSWTEIGILQQLVSQFVTYQLEREIKSDRFLVQSVV